MGKDQEQTRAMPSQDRPLPQALRVLLPVIVFAVLMGLWEATVRLRDIPPYILPAPSLIVQTLVKDWGILFASLMTTLRATLEGFLAAVIGGDTSPRMIARIRSSISSWKISRCSMTRCRASCGLSFIGSNTSGAARQRAAKGQAV